MNIRTHLLALLILAGGASARAEGLADAATTSPTVTDVKARGALACGVLTEPDDYTKDDTHGPLEALGAQVCKAVATAVLGDTSAVTLFQMPDEAHGLAALRSGKIDLFPTASPGAASAIGRRVAFGPTVFMDGQGLMVARGSGVASLRDLHMKQVCFIGDTRHETELHAAEARLGINVLHFPFEEVGEMEAALVGGHCAAMTADVSMLADARARFHGRVKDFEILPERLTQDPVAPAFRQDDAGWAAIVVATITTLGQAEATGVTRENVASRWLAPDPRAASLGLSPNWRTAVVRAVGNARQMLDATMETTSEPGPPPAPTEADQRAELSGAAVPTR